MLNVDDTRSTPLLLERRVQSLELDAGILRTEAPLDLSGRGVASLLPGTHLRLEALEIWHSSIQALPTEYAQLDLGHVEPRGVLGRVFDLKRLSEAPGLLGLEYLIQGGGGVDF